MLLEYSRLLNFFSLILLQNFVVVSLDGYMSSHFFQMVWRGLVAYQIQRAVTLSDFRPEGYDVCSYLMGTISHGTLASSPTF